MGECLRADHGMGREGALSKECQVLTNLGLAPDTPDTWNLLKLKNPEGPVPIPPTILNDLAVLPADFNLLQALRSFPKCTAAGLLVCRSNISLLSLLRPYLHLSFPP